MNRPRRSDWLVALLGLSLAVWLLSAVSSAAEIGRPFGGYKPVYVAADNTWIVDSLTPNWWPGLAQTDLQAQDVLLTLDGRPYGPDAGAIYWRASEAGRQSLPLVLARAGQAQMIQIPVTRLTFTQFLDIKLSDLLQALGLWLLGVAVYRAHPKGGVNRTFALACSLVSIVTSLAVQSFFPEGSWLSRALLAGFTLAFSWYGGVMFLFGMSFPLPLAPGVIRWRPLIFGLGLAMSLIYAIGQALRWTGGWSPLVGRLDMIGFYSSATAVLLGMVSCMVRWTWLGLSSRTPLRIRRQLRVAAIGMLVMSPYLLHLLVWRLKLSSGKVFWQYLDMRSLRMAVPLAVAYGIIRYQAFRSRDPLLLVVAVLGASALAAQLGSGLMWTLYPELRQPPFAVVFLVLVTAGLFWIAQSAEGGPITRIVRGEQRSFSVARRFGQRVIDRSAGGTGLTLSGIAQALAAALVSELEVERAAVWVRPGVDDRLELAAQHGNWPVAPPNALLPTTQLTFLRPILLFDERAEPPPWLAALADADGQPQLAMVFPLWAAGEFVGAFGLGNRWDAEIFDAQTLAVIELIAQQTALFLLTTQQLDKLASVPRQVAEAQERERRKIARELHDQTEQFMASLSLNLAIAQRRLTHEPERVDAMLQQALEELELAARTLRQIRSNLAPRQLEKGLVGPLKTLQERVQARTGLRVELDVAEELNGLLSVEARHALYRVIQQALDNVAEHAGAGCARVHLTRYNGHVRFSIKDDGRGFAAERRLESREEGCFGLDSMSDRIVLLGGELQIVSAPGTGTEINGWVPVSGSSPSLHEGVPYHAAASN